MALEDGCKSSSCVDLTRRMKNLIQRTSFEVHVLGVCRWIGIIPAGFAFYKPLHLYGEWVTDTTSSCWINKFKLFYSTMSLLNDH